MDPAFDREGEEDFDLGEASEADTELPHADERWLVSYADMMTLLFGFFVLLYAMSDKMDVVQKAASKEFNSAPKEQKGTTEPTISDVKSESTLNALQDERGKLVVRVKELEMELKHARTDAEADKKSALEVEALKDKVRQLSGQVDQSKITEKENTRLRAALAVKDIPPPTVHPAPEAKVSATEKPDPTKDAQYEAVGGNSDIHFVLIGQGFQSKVNKISLSGLQLEEPPPDSLGEKFKVTLKRDDGQGEIEVMVYASPGPGGQRTRRLSIVDFPNGDERKLRQWFKQMKGPGN